LSAVSGTTGLLIAAAPRAKTGTLPSSGSCAAGARANDAHFVRLRDVLLQAGTLEAGLLALLRSGPIGVPPLFIDIVVQAMLRGLLDGSDPERLARLFSLFRLFSRFRLEFEDSAEVRADVAGKPARLGLMATPEQSFRPEPQNLLLNLPLAPTLALAATRGAGPLGP